MLEGKVINKKKFRYIPTTKIEYTGTNNLAILDLKRMTTNGTERGPFGWSEIQILEENKLSPSTIETVGGIVKHLEKFLFGCIPWRVFPQKNIAIIFVTKTFSLKTVLEPPKCAIAYTFDSGDAFWILFFQVLWPVNDGTKIEFVSEFFWLHNSW